MVVRKKRSVIAVPQEEQKVTVKAHSARVKHAEPGEALPDELNDVMAEENGFPDLAWTTNSI
jgi:hypothetical protein